MGPWINGWLQNNYSVIKQQYQDIEQMIQFHYNHNLMLPFRRREFEVLAMVQEIFRRVADTNFIHLNNSNTNTNTNNSVCWRLLPLTNIRKASNLDAHRIIRIIADTSDPAVVCLVNELKGQLSQLSPTIQWINQYSTNTMTTTYNLIILTENILKQCNTELAKITNDSSLEIITSRTVCLYSTDNGWDFSKFYNQADSDVKRFIASIETLALHKNKYEREALLLELLKRMKIFN